MPRNIRMKLAMAAWEPGRAQSGYGVKIGGLGSVMEELPEELLAAADRLGIDLRIEVLSPCFGHYDRSGLEEVTPPVEVFLDGHTFPFTVYRRSATKNLQFVYFWDPIQLGWTNGQAIYPDDLEMGFKLYATVTQAMAGYVLRGRFNVVHGHDYHVGLLPFYLSEQYLAVAGHHFTIHNGTYQGIYPVHGHGYEMLERIGLPGAKLFHKYFDFFDQLNFLKAAVIRTHETGGKVTTVSGDLKGTWGYAAELRMSREEVWRRAREAKGWGDVRDVFLPNGGLDVLEHVPIVGITNGLSRRNWPQELPELRADYLRSLQERLRPGETLFRNPVVQAEMLARDHHYDADHLEGKATLKRLLHLEAFGVEPAPETVILGVVGRLVAQKNLGLVAAVAERVLQHFPGARFAVLASAPQGDPEGQATANRFRELANRLPDRFFFTERFSPALGKLILAGSDFALIPSRFEPCGLVDYEASVLGTIVIGHRIGGLAKVQKCAYLYDWLDIGDPVGEADAFYRTIREALTVYYTNPELHRRLMLAAMSLDAGWERAAEQYLAVYHYGMLFRDWRKKRGVLLRAVDAYAAKTVEQQPLFADLFAPVHNDILDLRLQRALQNLAKTPQ
ncbi:MAG: glycogen synthase GlgA [Acidobacteriota bacterium]